MFTNQAGVRRQTSRPFPALPPVAVHPRAQPHPPAILALPAQGDEFSPVLVRRPQPCKSSRSVPGTKAKDTEIIGSGRGLSPPRGFLW